MRMSSQVKTGSSARKLFEYGRPPSRQPPRSIPFKGGGGPPLRVMLIPGNPWKLRLLLRAPGHTHDPPGQDTLLRSTRCQPTDAAPSPVMLSPEGIQALAQDFFTPHGTKSFKRPVPCPPIKDCPFFRQAEPHGLSRPPSSSGFPSHLFL